jgi:hypothetical protein
MTKDEALDLALEALERMESYGNTFAYRKTEQNPHEQVCEAIAAIKQTRSAQPAVQEPVHQWRQKHSPYWYDGYPDNDDGGGPYETRTLYTTPPAAQLAPVKVWEAEGYDSLMQEMQMVKARNIRQHAEIERLKAAQPAVPDAFGTREGEHPQYIQGWNDCRAEMLRGKP